MEGEWKGILYPPNLKRKEFLTYYSTVFNALEINSTFYNMPTKDQMLSFCERTEGRVAFCIKANRSFTHELDSNWKEQAITFRQAIEVLAEKDVLKTILFQLSPSFNYTVENRKYQADLLQEFYPFKPVVEFRNSSWIKPSVFQGLVKFNSIPVFLDIPNKSFIDKLYSFDTDETINKEAVSSLYVRFHQRPNCLNIHDNSDFFY